MSERDDAARDTDADHDVVPARRRWVKWVWPATTFVLIAAFMLAAMFVRDLGPGSPGPVAAAPEPAQHLNTRAWRTIAADPEAHADERVILWGQVTAFAQADPTTFRANVDAARHQPKGGRVDYPTAVVLHGDPQQLSSLATGYIFKAEVTVDGAAPPEAAPSGAVTPRLTVTQLTVTDRTVG